MNTTQLECFMAVANFLNFSRAAEHLKITQPAVSHQINTLEDDLGVKLFHRTSKSVRLTQEGFQFTQYAGEILKLAHLSRERMRASRQAPARLVIGCRNAGELGMLRPALLRLRQEQPELLPVLRLIPFDSLENLLVEGDVDLIFSLRESAPQKARYRELARCPVVCVCGQDHPLSGGSR
jgi:DNA-binding transcriptional LysR family regulator